MQALEGFVACCPVDARPHLPVLITTGLKYLKYDPNFAGDEAMETDGEE